jgi:hypothetical protein
MEKGLARGVELLEEIEEAIADRIVGLWKCGLDK